MSNIPSTPLPAFAPQIETFRPSGDTTPPPREKIPVLVKASDVDKTLEIAFRLAEALGLPPLNNEVGDPERAPFATHENVYPIKFDFRPDGPDGRYTPQMQQKINQFKEQFDQRLRHEGIEDIGPDMFT